MSDDARSMRVQEVADALAYRVPFDPPKCCDRPMIDLRSEDARFGYGQILGVDRVRVYTWACTNTGCRRIETTWEPDS